MSPQPGSAVGLVFHQGHKEGSKAPSRHLAAHHAETDGESVSFSTNWRVESRTGGSPPRISRSANFMNVEIAEAQALVRRVEEALASGMGDCRSNEVIFGLLTVAKRWIYEKAGGKAAVFPTGMRSDPPSQALPAHQSAAD
jgi:hypothetical protein